MAYVADKMSETNDLGCEKEVRRLLVRRCERLDVGGMRRGRGRPKMYWGEVIGQDMA